MPSRTLVEQIAVLEQLKGALAARQARLSVAFDRAQRAEQVAAGVPARKVGRGVGEQIALARRESPSRGSRHLGMAKALVHEMPNALAALGAGQVSEYTAALVVQETACLSAEDRRAVDAELGERLGSLGPARARASAWAAACRLDPASAVRRCRKAVKERRVSLRPAPDAMTYLTALLPVRDGVAVYAALDAAAATARAAGDARKGCASAATTPSPYPAGEPPSPPLAAPATHQVPTSRPTSTPCAPPHPPDTPTTPPCRHCW